MTLQSPQCRCNSDFYYEDGTIVVCASDEQQNEQVLYRLHPSLLGKRSGMLKDMFTLPHLPAGDTSVKLDTVDGSDDGHPVHLPHPKITIRKFDNLLIYLFNGPSAYPQTDQFLFDVLDLSHFLDIPDGIDYVVQTLDHRVFRFNAVLRFRLARQYNITKWVEPALRQMMEWRGSTFTAQDALDIGFDMFYHIVSAKFKLEDMRKSMAYNAPALTKGPECRTSVACSIRWQELWWNGLGPHILHPQWTLVGGRIRDELTLSDMPGVCQGCKEKTLSTMEEKKLFDKDAEVVEECISTVKCICGDDSPLAKPAYSSETDYSFIY